LADYPCDWHGSRYQGPSHRVYLNIYREEEVVKLKGSICGDCLAATVTDWLGRALHMAAEGNWDPPRDGEDLDSLYIDAGRASGPLNGSRRR